ncbi:MAG TPA: hypothetical protein VMT17_14710 [Anaeromyxobacteraceae bacterium]|nr:hypothetical protein [Anaeromyxobacteraceae bacterium]
MRPRATFAAAAVLALTGAAGTRTGTVAGVLRYKGCLTNVPGATVAVIGRDRVATSDAGGRFVVELPGGSYSLVVRGPGIVADQRVDEVVAVPGKIHDLGIVEVWPDERPPQCTPAPPPAPGAEPTVAAAPDAPAVDLPGTGVGPSSAAPDQILVRGSAGTGSGQFALQGNPAREDEDALGPPSFAIGPQGFIYVLDSLNGRVQRFDPKGHFAASFPLARTNGEPVVEADIAVSDEGGVFVFTEGESPSLVQFDAAGKVILAGALPPSFKGVDQLVAGRQRPLFLMLNGQSVRGELGWGGIRAEGPFPGLPAGGVYVQAERASRWMVQVKFLAADGRVRRALNLRSQVPVTRVRLVGVSRRGDVVLAVDRAEGSDDEAARGEVLLLEVTPQGQVAGSLSVPPGDRRWEFREFALAPDGAIVQMQSDLAEVRLVRWSLQPAPRDAVAGEGMVKGRVFESGKPAAGAAVSVAKAHRSVATGPDGSFEVRVPAGTWAVSFRRSQAVVADSPPAELKVAVAAGATVDVGNVTLAPVRAVQLVVPPPAEPVP